MLGCIFSFIFIFLFSLSLFSFFFSFLSTLFSFLSLFIFIFLNFHLSSSLFILISVSFHLCPFSFLSLSSHTETALTSQMIPPTRNGHAPVKKELTICPSLLCLNLVSFFPCCVKQRHRRHSWWCPFLLTSFHLYLSSFSLLLPCHSSSLSSSLVLSFIFSFVFSFIFALLSSLVLSSPLPSCLVFSSFVFSCLLFLCLLSPSLPVSVGVCCLSMSLSPFCVVVVVCTLKNPVCTFSTSPCVRSKRPRVYRHHAHMLKPMCAWCRCTR